MFTKKSANWPFTWAIRLLTIEAGTRMVWSPENRWVPMVTEKALQVLRAWAGADIKLIAIRVNASILSADLRVHLLNTTFVGFITCNSPYEWDWVSSNWQMPVRASSQQVNRMNLTR